MREYIDSNLRVIKKHLKTRTKKLSALNKSSLLEEFREWNRNSYVDRKSIWTLPDLTREERLKNFCRSIKKEIK